MSSRIGTMEPRNNEVVGRAGKGLELGFVSKRQTTVSRSDPTVLSPPLLWGRELERGGFEAKPGATRILPWDRGWPQEKWGGRRSRDRRSPPLADSFDRPIGNEIRRRGPATAVVP